jgi:hypothetical protein
MKIIDPAATVMAKSTKKKAKATKVGQDGDGKKNKIEVVEPANEEDGGDEMIIDVEMADSDGGSEDTDTSGASDDDNDGDEVMRDDSAMPIPFLDTFYALSAQNASERTAAAHCLIRHCFPQVDSDADSGAAPVQTKDAAYALRRLLSGLCSGRAGARQGYASALSSFLRVAFAATSSSSDGELPIHAIQKELSKADRDDDAMDEDDKDDSSSSSSDMAQEADEHPAEFVRKLLLVQTTPRSVGGQKAAKKGSEERDYIFGRLFGIMAVVRSGTLFGADVPVGVSLW